MKRIYKLMLTEAVIQALIEGVILGVIIFSLQVIVLEPMLTPKTDIEVQCYEGKFENELTFEFHNKAEFAGDDFRIFIWGIEIDVMSVDVWNQLCSAVRIKDGIYGVYVECDYIPPETKMPISFLLKNESKSVDVTYWSKNTKLTKEHLDCLTSNK